MTQWRRRLIVLALAVVLFITLAVQDGLPGPLPLGVLFCLAAAWATVTLVLSIVEHRTLLAEGAWSATREQHDVDPGGGEDTRLTWLRFLVQDVLQDGSRTEELRFLLSRLAAQRGASAPEQPEMLEMLEVPEGCRLRDPKTLAETIRGIEEL